MQCPSSGLSFVNNFKGKVTGLCLPFSRVRKSELKESAGHPARMGDTGSIYPRLCEESRSTEHALTGNRLGPANML
ncbi:hypothetical protein D3C80_2142920 [compost metagenome]